MDTDFSKLNSVTESSVQIRLYDDNSNNVAYKRLTIEEVEKVLELLNMTLDKKFNEF